MLPLIRAKLYRPYLSAELVARPRLITLLRQYRDRPFLLVSAPAGFGKTTLLNHWAAECEWPVAWITLDENDNDVVLFLRYLVADVQTVVPEFGRDLQPLLKTGHPSVTLIADTLLNELDDLEQPLILVLDDYQAIHEPAIHYLIERLLRFPPRPLHLVIITRRDPPLPLAHLRARGQMAEIRTEDLRMTLEETRLFLAKTLTFKASDEDLAALGLRLEGWIAGLHLVTLSLRHPEDVKRFFEQPELHHYIMDYLMSQVLSSQPEVVQAWLLKTALLDRFCAPLAQAVCQPGDGADGTPPDEEINTGQEFLLWLEQSSLFTVWMAEQRAESWFRYHHLFKQFLLHHLRRRYEPAEINELHHRASVWFAKNGHVEEAIRHALTTGNIQIIAQVLGRYRHEAMNQEQWTRLERWLRLLPESVINEHPEPLLLRAWLWQFGGRIWEVAPVLDRAEALLDRLPPETVESRQGEIDVLHSALAFWSADAQRGLALAKQALARVPFEHIYVRDLAWLFVAAHQQMLGDLPAALATQDQAMQESPDGAFSMRRLFTLGLIRWVAGDLGGVAQTGVQLLKLARGSNRLFSDGAAHYLLGCVALERNDPDTAVLHFNEVLERRHMVHSLFYLHSTFGLALIYQDQGQVGEARELVAHALTLFFERTHIRQSAEAFLAHLALLNGWLTEAWQWATRINFELPLAPTSQLYLSNLTLIRLLIAKEQWQPAAEMLQRLRAFLQSIHNTRFLIDTSILQALVYHAQGDGGCALSCLEEAVQLAAPGGFIRPFMDLATELDPLLAELAGRDVQPEYIAQIRSAIRGDEWMEANLNEEVGLGLDLGLHSANGQFTPRQRRPPAPLIEDLTFRELDVLRLLDLRLTNKEIANELNISVATVKRHTAHIYQKLDVNNRRQASVIARNLDLLKPD